MATATSTNDFLENTHYVPLIPRLFSSSIFMFLQKTAHMEAIKLRQQQRRRCDQQIPNESPLMRRMRFVCARVQRRQRNSELKSWHFLWITHQPVTLWHRMVSECQMNHSIDNCVAPQNQKPIWVSTTQYPNYRKILMQFVVWVFVKEYLPNVMTMTNGFDLGFQSILSTQFWWNSRPFYPFLSR